jgi:integrase
VHGVITTEQAREVTRQWLADASRGSDPARAKRTARDLPTMAEFAERYLAKHARIHKKASSLANNERLLAKRILPVLGRRKLNDVSREDVARLHEELRSTPYQANRLLALLSKMFNLAEEWELRPEGSNPCRRIRKFGERKRQRFLGPNELARLGVVIEDEERHRTHAPGVFAAIKLLLFHRLSAERDPDPAVGGGRPPAFLLAAGGLEDWPEGGVPELGRARSAGGYRTGAGQPHVIRGAKAGSHLVNREKPWSRLREKAGLADVRLHDLRHSLASAGATNGLSLPLLGALLGHTTPATTNMPTWAPSPSARGMSSWASTCQLRYAANPSLLLTTTAWGLGLVWGHSKWTLQTAARLHNDKDQRAVRPARRRPGSSREVNFVRGFRQQARLSFAHLRHASK